MEPEIRATILVETLRCIANSAENVSASAVLAACQQVTGLPEEQCALEVHVALLLLCRSGLILSDSFNVGEESSQITISADTLFVAAPSLTAFIWRDSVTG